MKKSENIDELAKALSKAQAVMGSPTKGHTATITSTKGSYKYTYADLASVWEACRKPLTENGLSIVQTTSVATETLSADGEVQRRPTLLETTLLHESGQWYSSELPITPTQDTPQAFGSALTYARRQGLAAMVMVAPEDDDGETASKGTPRATKTEQVAPRQYPPGWPKKVVADDDDRKVWAAGLKRLQMTEKAAWDILKAQSLSQLLFRGISIEKALEQLEQATPPDGEQEAMEV